MKVKLLKKIRKKFHIRYRKEVVNTLSVKRHIKNEDFANVNDLFEVSKSEVVDMWVFKSKKYDIGKKSQYLRDCIIWAKENL